jgi:hypothetical protein
MFPTEMVPAATSDQSQAWSQAPDAGNDPAGPQSGLFPGWTGMYPAVATAGGPGALAPRPERRRKAIYAIAGIAAATVLVLLAAILVAPHLGSSNEVADKDGQPVAVSSVGSSSAASSAAVSTASASRPQNSAPNTAAGPAPVAPATVTVTTTARQPTTSTAAPTAKAATTSKTTPKPKPKPKPPKTTVKKPPAPALGVPQRDIACSGGYIVQLASELDAATFAAHVARLKASGQLPGGAMAADSKHSCDLFSSQSNTVVLYAGPFGSKYGGCAARLAGPADAYIKGGNPGTATEYVSCLCPATATRLPRLAAVGQQDVWIGELQRVLGNRLNIDVSDLSGNWGVYTPGTKAAVKTFQRRQKLPATGVVDARTWRRMQVTGC